MENEQVISKKKKSPIRLIIVGIVVLVGGYFGYKEIHYALTHETTDNAEIETQITPVLPRVSGYVKVIDVKDYDSVKAGKLLVELDDADLQSELLQMEADSSSAVADIENAKAALNNAVVSLKSSKGTITLNDVKVKQAQENYQRNQNLYADQAITKKQLDDSKFDLDQALQQLTNSQADYSAANSRIAVLEASIQKADASLDMKKAVLAQQRLKISYCKIYAPQSGKIGKKNISEGQYVQAGTPLFSIVDDSNYWIVANFKETQITRFYPGMPVEIDVDAYPDSTLKGSIESLSKATGASFSLLPPDNASGNFVKVTQRVPVKIDITDADKYRRILRDGLSVTVSVPIN